MRAANCLRPVEINRQSWGQAPGRVLYQSGETVVLCTASVQSRVPDWMVGKGKGWVTAEYNMLPHSTGSRKNRDRSGKVDGRTTEIQRLIGRSLRAIVDLEALGEHMITVDCDVLQADGGTRTAAITGGYIALVDAIRSVLPEAQIGTPPVIDSVAAVSVGVVDNEIVLDLDYPLDFAAQVDMNVVMTGSGRFVEIQGTGEEATFDDDQLAAMLKLARSGIAELTERQRTALAN
ncbi:Ribonuclease PH [Roseimaritima multifibrata]|uniref:Ribonuclease PH n=1 Tax=Roseimaritima multifibrata TaxID=1930274 RepID=A0A517MKI2_9BACT|nr:ribonuclease PH [Roseimaritima multifibrata]QDS95396.1 Ribonuclease PH [Roseimaritima multifibrata]